MGKYLTHDHDLGDLARNPDLITGAAGSHPTGVAIGAAGGAASGAAFGSLGGPLGTVVGLFVGAVVGGYTGKAAGEWRDPTEDAAFRRRHYATGGYVPVGDVLESYDDGFVEPRRNASPFALASSAPDAVPAGVFDRPAAFGGRVRRCIRSTRRRRPSSRGVDCCANVVTLKQRPPPTGGRGVVRRAT